MKKIELEKKLNETVIKKMNLDEESYFEGYDFITNGHEVENFDSNITDGELIKRSIIIKWKLKFDMGHIGIYSANVEIKSVTASIEQGDQQVPLNLNGFEHKISMVKNPEVQQMQIFIKSIFIDVNAKQIILEFTL